MKRRILLLEDEPTIQRLLNFILSDTYDLHFVQNGFEAMLWIENNRIPDLIIMDWMMPQMDGKSFVKCIKVSGMYSEIPIIVLSGCENVGEELSEMTYTIERQFSKPFDPKELKEAVSSIMNTLDYGVVN
jgi:two-component system chemotaxis response regulator CheY